MAPPGPGTAAAGDASPSAAADVGLDAILHTARDLWQDLPGLFTDRLALLSLEVERAARALVEMVVLGVAAALLAITGWVLMWGCILVALVQWGLPLPAVLLGAVAFNLLAAWLVVSRARRLWPRLSLPATRRHLTPGPSTVPADAGAPSASHERHDHLNAAGAPAAG